MAVKKNSSVYINFIKLCSSVPIQFSHPLRVITIIGVRMIVNGAIKLERDGDKPTGAISGGELAELADDGYLPDDMIGRAGVDAGVAGDMNRVTRDAFAAQILRGTLGRGEVERARSVYASGHAVRRVCCPGPHPDSGGLRGGCHVDLVRRRGLGLHRRWSQLRAGPATEYDAYR